MKRWTPADMASETTNRSQSIASVLTEGLAETASVVGSTLMSAAIVGTSTIAIAMRDIYAGLSPASLFPASRLTLIRVSSPGSGTSGAECRGSYPTFGRQLAAERNPGHPENAKR